MFCTHDSSIRGQISAAADTLLVHTLYWHQAG